MTKIVPLLFLILPGLATFGQMNNQENGNSGKKMVYEFVSAINDHNIDQIYSLMADDHVFIDAHGNQVAGKDKMKAGWTGYFQWFPDYKIEITEIFSHGDTLAAFGFASGTFKGIKTENRDNYWRIPASWRILLSQDKIKLWQVYADTKIPFDIINKNK
jgi:ketosteroid isomerase-like protein